MPHGNWPRQRCQRCVTCQAVHIAQPKIPAPKLRRVIPCESCHTSVPCLWWHDGHWDIAWSAKGFRVYRWPFCFAVNLPADKQVSISSLRLSFVSTCMSRIQKAFKPQRNDQTQRKCLPGMNVNGNSTDCLKVKILPHLLFAFCTRRRELNLSTSAGPYDVCTMSALQPCFNVQDSIENRCWSVVMQIALPRIR